MLAVMLPLLFTESMCKLALTAIQLHGPVHQQPWSLVDTPWSLVDNEQPAAVKRVDIVCRCCQAAAFW